MYHIQLEQFEGPFPLLISLIEKEKLDITRVALASVTEQFLAHIEREQEMSLPNLAQFLSVASRLVLLKSRSLLPTLIVNSEEERDAEDLERRLSEYRKFQEISVRLGRIFSAGFRSFHREFERISEPIFVASPGLSGEDLANVFAQSLERIPIPIEYEEESIQETVTLEECIALLEHRIARSAEGVFSDIVTESNDRIEVIVSFLAILELVRRRTFAVQQENLFGEIRFFRLNTSN